MSRLAWLLRNVFRQLWFTAGLYSLAGIATALSALFLDPYLPVDLGAKIGVEAVDRILGILASSMLAVTTFSIATMVSAYAAAATGATPRATRLLVEDRAAQNALATFLGAFLFSIVSIIALATGAYGASGRILLFFVTIVVVILIVIVLVRWIDKLSRLGRVTETIDQVEQAAAKAMRAHAKSPLLGACSARGTSTEGLIPVCVESVGYVQNVDVAHLSGCAEKSEIEITVAARPGAFVTPDRALAYVRGRADDDVVTTISKAFSIGDRRSYDQDPRFGLIVLSEIASRALSPAVNDPGTAIDVIGTAVRVLALAGAEVDEPKQGGERDIAYPRVFVPPILAEELFDDVITPIARDGAALVEVMIRLQKALRALAAMNGDFNEAAVRHAQLAVARAEKAMTLDEDKQRVRAAANWL